LKKNSNFYMKREQNSKPAKARVPVQRDAKEVMAELGAKLTEKLDAKPGRASAEDEGQSSVLRPNLDRLTVGVDLGDKWSSYCILGMEGEALAGGAEGRLRTTVHVIVQT
jgi:hypothetical protein